METRGGGCHKMKQTGQTRVMDMSLCECMKKKFQQATCDKIDWNRKILKWRKCFKEAEKAICGECKKPDKKRK